MGGALPRARYRPPLTQDIVNAAGSRLAEPRIGRPTPLRCLNDGFVALYSPNSSEHRSSILTRARSTRLQISVGEMPSR